MLAAFGVNGLFALAKFAAALLSGSAAMFSEAIHSLADTGNQGMMMLGIGRAQRSADTRDPLSHGKELYFWGFVIAVLLFSTGAGVSIYEGVRKLRQPSPIDHAIANYIVLAVALALELVFTFVALKELEAKRGTATAFAALRRSNDPTLLIVLLEGLASLAGLSVALAGILVSELLGYLPADAIASVLIGLILAAVAAFMSLEIKAVLTDGAVSPNLIDNVRTVVDGEAKKAKMILGNLRTMDLGSKDLIATVDGEFPDNARAVDVEQFLARLEVVTHAQFPEVKGIFFAARSDISVSQRPTAEPFRRDAIGNLEHNKDHAPPQSAPQPARTEPRKANHPSRKRKKSKKRRH
jgi:cation diffusion facilitator family transporter